MIKLFNANDTDFSSNGIVAIHPLKLVENKQKSLNGWFIDVELDLQHKDLINQDMLAVVKTKSKLNPQAFRIKNIKYTNRKISFKAEHVMFDADDYYLKDVRPTSMGAIGALNYVNERTDSISPFSFSSDVNNTSTAYFMDRSLLYAMQVIEERWGGEFTADNFHISLKKNVGVDRGETIVYGKNLEGIQIFEDWSSVATKIFPVGFDGLRLPEGYLQADFSYPKPYTKRVDIDTDSEASEEDQIIELREKSQLWLEQNKYPRVSYEVKSDVNQDLEIGDTVHVKHPLVNLATNVQEYDYNILAKRVTKVVFGNYNRDVKKRFNQIKDSIQEVKSKASIIETIISDQTDLINNLNKFGYVYIDDNQILILDSTPKENAINVWRFNMGGLAFSEHGIEGPYKQAWTIDGTFNTEFIAAGSIVANQLAADIGSSLDLSSNTSITSIVENIQSIELNKTFFKYSPTENGDPMSDNPDGDTKYIGVASAKTKPTEPSEYTWSLMKGLDGINGRSVESTTAQFYLSDSKTELIGGEWLDTSPTWTVEKYLWTRYKIEYANPTGMENTDPTVDSGWERTSELETRVSSAEQKITPQAITNTVLSSKDYTDAITQINAKIDKVELSVEKSNYFNTLVNGTGEDGDHSNWEFEVSGTSVWKRNVFKESMLSSMTGVTSVVEVFDYDIPNFHQPNGAKYYEVSGPGDLLFQTSTFNREYQYVITGVIFQPFNGAFIYAESNGLQTLMNPQGGANFNDDLEILPSDPYLFLKFRSMDNKNPNVTVFIKKGTLSIDEYEPPSGEKVIFEILDDETSLAGKKLSFHTNGIATNGKFRIVKGREYSYSVKRTTGSQTFSIDVNEYDSNRVFIQKSEYTFNQNKYVEKTNLNAFDEDALYISITYSIGGVNGTNRLELTEAMMNIGDPQEWNAQKDAADVFKWARTEIELQSAQIQQKVSVIDYTGNNIASMINQTATTIKMLASKIEFEGLVTANENFKILLDGSIEAVNATLSGELVAGKIGDWFIENGKILSLDNGIEMNSIDEFIRYGNVRMKYGSTSKYDILDIHGVNKQALVRITNDYFKPVTLEVSNGIDIISTISGETYDPFLPIGLSMLLVKTPGTATTYDKLMGVFKGNPLFIQGSGIGAPLANKVVVSAEVLVAEQIWVGGQLRTITRDSNGFLKAT